jgi:hypothetical protein
MSNTKDIPAHYKHIRITQADLVEEAKLRFGDDVLNYAFRCPHCHDVATIREWKELGEPGRAGQDCIGRATGATTKPKPTNTRGCDWAAYGLFRGPWEIVVPAEDDKPERSVWGFPLAGDPAENGPVLRAIAEKAEATR